MHANKKGGYDDGYKKCPCFWGRGPGSLILKLGELLSMHENPMVLDLGCGEGKNAAYLAHLGVSVIGVDISEYALANGRVIWGKEPKISWVHGDVSLLDFPTEAYDATILYGLPHCFTSVRQLTDVIKKVKSWTKTGGYVTLVTFNDRRQELAAHPGFVPLLLSHEFYESLFKAWTIIQISDSDLTETHPNNNIRHTHSLTRILARKR